MHNRKDIFDFLHTLSNEELNSLFHLASEKPSQKSEPSKAFTLPDSAKKKLDSITKVSPFSRSNDPDTTKWADYVKKIQTLNYTFPEHLKDKTEKEIYHNLLATCRERHLPEDFALEISSSVLEYITTGYTKPIMLHGPAGCGKTMAGIILSEVLKTKCFITSVTAADHRHSMLGEGSSYKSADIGEFWRGILETETLNPVFIIDEIDKTVKNPEHTQIQDELLTILNDETLTVTDNFMNFPLSLRNSLIIFTCNDIEKVSEPLRDRCMVYTFTDAEPDRLYAIVEEYARKKAEAAEGVTFSPDALSKGVTHLYNRGVRSIRQHKALVDNAFKHAKREYLSSDCDCVTADEEIFLCQAEKLTTSKKRTAGF